MNWDEYFLDIMDTVASKSKDPSTKVGAVIVSPDNTIKMTGFNGLPKGMDDNDPKYWVRPIKYKYVEHSERNAIALAAKDGIALNQCRIYVKGIPCADCARSIVQSGMTEVIIRQTDYDYWKTKMAENWKDENDAALEIFDKTGVKVRLV